MSTENVRFLDFIPGAQHFIVQRNNDTVYWVANTIEGIKKFVAQPKHALVLWIASRDQFHRLKKEAERYNPFYIFTYGSLRPSEIYDLGDFKAPLNCEIPDRRISDPDLLNPEIKVLQKSLIPSPKTSIVIPLYDNAQRAKKCLSSWLAQNQESYEIVLVDDGSPDSWIEELIGEFPQNLTLLKLFRGQRRTRGDHNFRAGLARNLGFKHTKGTHIVFSDSDILVPEYILELFNKALNDAEYVMPQRWQLSENASAKIDLRYSEIVFDRDVILSPGAHWESFQHETHHWPSKEFFWKWASSFCFATKRATLERSGLFNRTFVSYGFEDTELAYRIMINKGVFQLLETKTYHLYQPASHSEYQNNLKAKERLLKISADRFFRHHPRKEVYEALKSWLE